jgi:hypothetical protein
VREHLLLCACSAEGKPGAATAPSPHAPAPTRLPHPPLSRLPAPSLRVAGCSGDGEGSPRSGGREGTRQAVLVSGQFGQRPDRVCGVARSGPCSRSREACSLWHPTERVLRP